MRKRYVIRIHTELRALLDREAHNQKHPTGRIANDIVELMATSHDISRNYEVSPLAYIFELTHNNTEKNASPQMSVYISDKVDEIIQKMLQDSGAPRMSIVISGLIAEYFKQKGWLSL